MKLPPGPVCPFGDGRHKLKVAQWGFACVRCSKTFEWVNGELVATYDRLDKAPKPDTTNSN